MTELDEELQSWRHWKTGDELRLSCPHGEKTTARVILASPNGKSLALSFEAIMGGFVGTMPVMWLDEKQRFEDWRGHVWLLEPLEPQP